jgi:hypothetical protein
MDTVLRGGARWRAARGTAACAAGWIAATVLGAVTLALAETRAADAVNPAVGWAAAFGDGGSSSREVRRAALESLPVERMPESHRRVVEGFTRSTTLFRRLPSATVTCDADLLAFLLDKPDALVDVWRVLGISRLALDPVGATQWRLSDGYGTIGIVRLLHRERSPEGGLLVFHGRGAYTGPLSPRDLTGGCLVVVRHRPVAADATGAARHAVEIDAFLDVDGIGLEIVTRALHPLIVHSAASNLHEIALFVTQFAAAGARNPEGVARLTERMPRTSAADRRMLASLIGGDRSRSVTDTAAGDVQTELAARWLSVDQLDAVRQR